MLTVKLIEDPSYYKHRRRQLYFFLLPCIPVGIICGMLDFNYFVIAAFFLLASLTLYFSLRNQGRINKAAGGNTLIFESDALRIQQGTNSIETIPIKGVQSIGAPQDLGIPQEHIQGVYDEFSGKPLVNYIELNTGENSRRLEFELTTYYAVQQFEKLLSTWRAAGIEIIRL